MGKWEVKFYKSLGIDTNKSQLELSDMVAIVGCFVKNLNPSGMDMNLIFSAIDKKFPSKSKLKESILPFFNIDGKRLTASDENYWLLRGHTHDSMRHAVDEYKRKIAGKNTIAYWIDRGCSQEEAESYVKEEQSRRSSKGYEHRDGISIRENSVRCVEYYTKRGVSEEEAKRIISAKSSSYGRAAKGAIPIENRNTRVEYYIKRGVSAEEAIVCLTNRQVTFSLNSCIEKYGVENGMRIFEERQTAWQYTLNSKPQNVKDEINRRKSDKRSFLDKHSMDEEAYFYIIKVDASFIKIGITTKRDITLRYSENDLGGCDVVLFKEGTVYTSLLMEQFFKNMLHDSKIHRHEKIRNFGWTETFKDVDVDALLHLIDSLTVDDYRESFIKNQGYMHGMGRKGYRDFRDRVFTEQRI